MLIWLIQIVSWQTSLCYVAANIVPPIQDEGGMMKQIVFLSLALLAVMAVNYPTISTARHAQHEAVPF
ncbi:hypothetical protein D3W54_12385 [Komagataeibacter medellinensis]|uniref:Uncharacterized protein n=1 Tax=Komagataeibacter medellinensis TaxID=1177712 RepID=A0ABQ6VXD6_9PROT|nr:hypothetical protein D3W54_12385 [Komagataeibacter medellinensis]